MAKKKKKKNGMTPAQAAAARYEREYEAPKKGEFGDWWERTPRQAKMRQIGGIVGVIIIMFVILVVPYLVYGPIDS